MNTIIEKIRAEVERRIKKLHCADFVDEMLEGPSGNDGFLSFLSDLEKEEKPSEGLEEETEKFIETFGWGKTKHLAEKELISATALHFYELGCRRTAEKYDEIEYKRQRAEESVPKDLEEAAENYAELLPQGRVSKKYSAIDFIAGAKWQKEQMMKEAVEGEVFSVVLNRGAVWYVASYPDGVPLRNRGDRVRIIVCNKED